MPRSALVWPEVLESKLRNNDRRFRSNAESAMPRSEATEIHTSFPYGLSVQFDRQLGEFTGELERNLVPIHQSGVNGSRGWPSASSDDKSTRRFQLPIRYLKFDLLDCTCELEFSLLSVGWINRSDRVTADLERFQSVAEQRPCQLTLAR